MSYRLCRFFLVGVMAAMVGMACAPRPKSELAPFPKSRAAADQLFQQAEKKYQASAFPEALALFQEYLFRYPDEPLAPAALMRIGGIHSLQGNPVQARKAYAQLISDYPSSSLRTEAILENMSSLLRDGRHQEVVAQGAEALKLMSIPAQRARAFALLGDAQAAQGAQLKAVEAYTRAMKLASPTEQELLVPKLRSAILHMSREEVLMLAQRGEDDLPMDYLQFQAGMLYAGEGRSQEAVILLKSFRDRYPGHEYAERAGQAIAEAEKGMPLERRVLGCLLPFEILVKALCEVRPYEKVRGAADAAHRVNLRRIEAAIADGDIVEARDDSLQALALVPAQKDNPRPLVGIAGDVYTKVNPAANNDLYRWLEDRGLEVWPAPFQIGLLDFGISRRFFESASKLRLQDLLVDGSIVLKRLIDVWRIHRVAAPRITRLEEPGYLAMKRLAAPYMPNEAHELLFLNTVKIVDYARRGADGIINAICFNCMVGNASAAVIEKIRRDYQDIPIITAVYSGGEDPSRRMVLEAFATQVKEHHKKRQEPITFPQ